jgi:transposase
LGRRQNIYPGPRESDPQIFRECERKLRRLKSEGFLGSLRVVGDRVTRRRRSSKVDSITIAAIEASVPTFVDARTLTDRFLATVRKRTESDPGPRIAGASQSPIASFSSGGVEDIAATHAALIQPWSSGRTESHITRFKPVKRWICGRAKIISCGPN